MHRDHQTYYRTVDALLTLGREAQILTSSEDRVADKISSLEEFEAFYADWIVRFRAKVLPRFSSPFDGRERFSLFMHGLSGAATLGDGIDLQKRYTRLLWGERAPLAWRETCDAVEVVLRTDPSVSTITCVRDLVILSILASLAEWLVGGPLEGVGCRIAKPRLLAPASAALLWRGAITYDAPESVLSIPKRHLGLAIADRRDKIAAFIDCLPLHGAPLDRTEAPLRRAVAEMIRGDLRRSPVCSPTCAGVAARMGVSEMTLRRQLRRSGTGFREIRNDVLDAIAKDWIAQGKLSIEALAERLGYSDATAFRRWFRNRNGCPPSAYRRRGSRGPDVPAAARTT
jgi:AraC-like DNA-binding protein